MATLVLGPLRIGAAAARRAGLVAAAAAVAGGLWLGVATAADPAGAAAPGIGEPPLATIPGARVPSRKPAPGPLHKAIAARLRGEKPAQQQSRVLVGRFVGNNGGTAVISVASGRLRPVRITAQTRLPARRPRAGEAVIVLGKPGPDGAFHAQAIMLRAGNAAGQQGSRLAGQGRGAPTLS